MEFFMKLKEIKASHISEIKTQRRARRVEGESSKKQWKRKNKTIIDSHNKSYQKNKDWKQSEKW